MKKLKALVKVHTEERRHALLGSSGMYRAMNCTGSVFLTKNLPPEKTRPEAEEGTIFHDLCEHKAAVYLEAKREGLPFQFQYGEEHDEEMILYSTDYIKHLWKNVFKESTTGKIWGFEEQVWLDEKLDMGGYEDFFMFERDERGNKVLWIVDIKYGRKLVESKQNPQLAFLICAMREECLKKGKDIDYAIGVIYQPRAYGKKAWDQTKFTLKQLDVWREKFFKTAETIFIDKKPKFKVGSWCEYCRAAGTCEALALQRQKDLGLSLIDANKVKLPSPKTLTPEQRSRIALAADDIISYVKDVKGACIESYLHGKPVKGTKVVEGSSRRQWITDKYKVEKSLAALGAKDVYNQKLKGIGEVEVILAKKHGKNKVKKLLKKLVTMTNPPMLLVPEGDERPPAKTMLSKLKIIED